MRGAMSHRKRPDTSDAALVAGVAQRAAGLLRGGVPAARVWRVLGEEAGAPDECVAIAAQITRGESAARALAAVGTPAWRLLAAAWQLAEQSGAPLALALQRFGTALGELQRVADRRAVLLAGPRATIRLVTALPLLALLLGVVLGFDPVGVLMSSLGLVLASVGGLLLAAGMWWARAMIDTLANADWVAGFEFELCWIALAGGATPGPAFRSVADSVDLVNANWVRLGALRRDGPVRQALGAAAAIGTPAGQVLLAEAEGARSKTLTELEQRAERLGVRVLAPLALCVLPSFVVLGVMPVLIAVLGTLAADVS
ncbi:MAG: type II secretion system F family protein [Leucobacter sp.]|nr:type II secretion system F family protein [Leucobacter sp.]